MWKDLFYFTRKEKKAVFVLIGLIILLSFSSLMIPYFLALKQSPVDYRKDIEAYIEFRESLQRMEEKSRSGNNTRIEPHKPALFIFNPNTADSSSFIRLGLKPFQARNILKYRNKGGRFKIPEDFSKIYGLNRESFERLKPYIQIPEDTVSTKKPRILPTDFPEYPKNKPDYPKQEKYAEGTVIDLNTADTTELKKIPGIGSVFSERIVTYRNRLGGFYSPEQLKEVRGVTPEMYLQLQNRFRVNPAGISRISVNHSDFNRLISHPYISYPQAKAFIELKKKKGRLHSFDQISLLEEFSEKDIERLTPYLSFD
ncbi:MAG: helix-hairpin-helix domain-containing protein [Candidatus Azobacteroides sp.]|nr:helix-hairpin-helix domain-containing protein [Candidatus Azobacteroides sp.]